MKNTCLFYRVFQVFLLQSLANQFFYLLLFNISFYISRYIIFDNFSELDSKLSEKHFCLKFTFFNGFTHPCTPLMPKICYTWWKFSDDISLLSTCSKLILSALLFLLQALCSPTRIMNLMKINKTQALVTCPVIENSYK